MKKILSLLLAMIMVFSLAACSGNSGGSATETKSNDATTVAAKEGETQSGEVYKVKLGFPTMQAIPNENEVDKVENFINAHLRDDLGITDFELDIQFVSLFDYATNLNMDLASGATWDIIYTLGDLPTGVTNGYFTDLTPYLDNELKGAVDVIKDWLACGTIDGTVYAIPCYKGQVLSWKYIYNEAYGDAYDMSKVHDLDTLTDALTAMKEKYPDETFEVFNNQFINLTSFEDHTSVVGTYTATVGESTELMNYFATDAFKRGVELAYKHRKAGFSDPEGSTNTQTHDALVMSGSSKGVVMGHAYSIETIDQMFTMNNTYGATFKSVEIGRSDMTTNTLTYGIPYTSGNPSAAAKMMNLIWTDEVVANALIYGLEGESWEWNADHTSIQYPAGLDINTVPYTALYTCGAFGNQFLLYGFDGNTSESDKVFMKELIDTAWYPPLFGFMPSSEKVSTQVAAVSNVYNQYFKPLTYGDVNPDEVLPQFLAELEAAGINDIIAEYQTQVDAWLTSK